MRTKLIWLFFFVSLMSSFACINEYRTLLSGEVVYIDPISGKLWKKAIDTLAFKKKADNLLTAYHRSDSIAYYSDYAAALTYLGDYQKAKNIYAQIETLSPNLYTTASNIGTIYELIGKPDSSLIWINKSIQLNPNSHQGSEWIHLKILAYKISKTQKSTPSILGLNFGNEEIPTNPLEYNLEELKHHIWHQLKERTTFVKPKNEIVGNIYFDLGNILAQTNDVQAALESYEAAKMYGFDSELMNRRSKTFEKLAFKAKPYEQLEDLKDFIRDNFKILCGIGLAIFTTFLLLISRFYNRTLDTKKNK